MKELLVPEQLRVAGVEHRFIDLPGLRMHVAEAGAGDPVLLLHGFPQHWWEWRSVIPGLAEQYRVICPDLRGAGWTDAPPSGYTRDRLLADLVALLDALEIERVRLIGHDVGAIGSFALCLEHPDRVTSHIALSVPPPFIAFNVRLLPVMRHLWFQEVLAIPGIGARLVSRGQQRLPRYIFSHFGVRADAWSDETIGAYVARLREPDRARAASALYRNMVLPEFQRILRGRYKSTRLHTPTLLLFGAADAAFTPGLAEVLLHGHEAYADLAFIDGAGHFIVDEAPEQVLSEARRFFAEHPVAA